MKLEPDDALIRYRVSLCTTKDMIKTHTHTHTTLDIRHLILYVNGIF